MNRSRQLSFFITAGPTREYLDPVRFITNGATGAIGYALTREALRRKHSVTLASGATHLRVPDGCRLFRFETAEQLQALARRYASAADCIIATAAVGDYRPRQVSAEKIKKQRAELTLSLVRNPDVLEELGRKKHRQVVIGFALETGQVLAGAEAKLRRKNLDLIVANRITAEMSPFGSGPTSVILLDRDGVTQCYDVISKQRLARILLDSAERLCYSLGTKN